MKIVARHGVTGAGPNRVELTEWMNRAIRSAGVHTLEHQSLDYDMDFPAER